MGIIRERLVEAREFCGYNRKDFAAELGIPYRTITNYENGSREPGSDYLLKVADKCGVTTDWLLGLSDSARENSPYSNLLIQNSDCLFESLYKNYECLNEEGRNKLVDYSDDLVRSGKYKKFISNRILQKA